MKIAIQGHPDRGEDVKNILKMLINNPVEYDCNNPCIWYEIHGKLIIPMILESPDYKYYTLEEFEEEFPFKIGDKVIYDYDPYIGTVVDIKFDDNIPYRVNINGTICTCETKLLHPYKPMKEERNITLTLDKAKEWYNKGGELKEIALQAFTKDELNPLPKSWEEYCKGHIVPSMRFESCTPLKYTALWKLEKLRDCYRQGWKPDWELGYIDKYCITVVSNKLLISTRTVMATFLSFQSREVAEEFLKNFDYLIKAAGDLI